MALEGDDFGTISKVNQIFIIINEVLDEKTQIPEIDAAKKAAKSKFVQFKKDFKADIFPLIYAAELLNPSLALKLTEEEQSKAIGYIAQRARELGHPLPNPNETSNSSNAQSSGDILQYSDSSPKKGDLIDKLQIQSNRELPREPEKLLKFWLDKVTDEKTEGIALVALEVLSTLCNSASVEREFSNAKHILTMNRMRLVPEIVEDLLIISANPDLAKKYLDQI